MAGLSVSVATPSERVMACGGSSSLRSKMCARAIPATPMGMLMMKPKSVNFQTQNKGSFFFLTYTISMLLLLDSLQ